jgi:rSAM/selenodomain-associated transferase 2
MDERSTISVVIPTLNEERVLGTTLARCVGGAEECIVVDGGSTDSTREIARSAGAKVLRCERGRGRQLAAGAAAARGEVLVFVHADTLLPKDFALAIHESLRTPGCTWGRFDVRFDQTTPLLTAIAHLISWRSWLTRGATGDQAIFVRADAYGRVGGFLEQDLFEDVDLCRRLKRDGKMAVPRVPVVTSSRRWRRDGVWRTSIRMWTLKALFLLGVPAERLGRRYRDVR